MPLYVCNAAKGAISQNAKSKIAEDVTRIHCDVTGAPATFVHVFFFEDAPQWSLNGKSALLFGSIRAGRTDEQKKQIADEIRHSLRTQTEMVDNDIITMIADTPASWVMEGGDLMPEPGEEAAWLAAHEAKMAAEKTA